MSCSHHARVLTGLAWTGSAIIRRCQINRTTLEGWVADRNTPQKVVWRSRIVLLSADRIGKMAIVRAVGKCKRTVDRWQERYVARGLAGLQRDATRRGRKPPLAASVIERAVKMTLHEKPPAATQWSARTLAKALGISHTSVQRIWNAHGLKPHLVKTFKLSNDKRFVEKVKYDSSTAGKATITNNSFVNFKNASSVGSASLVNNDVMQFFDTSTAGSETLGAWLIISDTEIFRALQDIQR